MLKFLFRYLALIRLVLTRLWSHPGLTLLALMGIVLSVGLVNSASFFAKAVDQVILWQELDDFSAMTGRPPFSTSLYTFASARAPLSLQDVEELSHHVANTLATEVGLPIRHQGLEVHSGNMMLRPKEGSQYGGEEDSYLESTDIVYIANVGEYIKLVAGDPIDENIPSEGVLDVWMHTRMAEKMGINVGEEFNIGINVVAEPIPIRVRGVWEATDPEDPFWFENPNATLQSKLLVRRQDYLTFVQPMIPGKTWYVSWHIILEDNKVLPDYTEEYLDGFQRAMNIINKYVPDVSINMPPLDPLESFVQRGNTLTILLLSFNLPAFGFLAYFLILTSAIIARWQQRETSTLVSRGIRPTSILTITLVEEIVLFIIGTPLGVGFGMLIAIGMGYTSSFLSYVQRDPLPISLRGITIPMTIVALAITLLARLMPALKATRLSSIAVDREHARPQSPPFWYRAYLDFLLLLPTSYAYRQLVDKGTLALLVKDKPEDLYQDPLLILVPALFILTMGLLSLRIFPLIMRLIDFISSFLPWVSPHLALRQLGRQSHVYINPLLLVIVSLALGVYMLSMAASLDQWLIDRMYYQTGTDLSFAVYPPGYGQEDGSTESILSGEWIPTPAEFQGIPGVLGATRVGNYSMSTSQPGTGDVRGQFMAVDRTSFGAVSWFRKDFSDESLGGLMNHLAQWSNAVLVSEKFYEENHLRVGDEINIRIGINYELIVNSKFTVAGTYKYFPTVYEDEKAVIIGNLDYLNFYVGMTVPHDIWLRIQDNVTGEAVLEKIPVLDVQTAREGDARERILEEQSKFERVGVFGTLSVGFIAAVVMATMGLLIYTYASLQERLHRFTILRAVGLQRRQITTQVVLEYAILTGYGAVMGAVIGASASQLFVPLFRITEELGQVVLPTLIPIIARDRVTQLVTGFVIFIVLTEVIVIAKALSQRAYTMLKGVFG
ncbi:MAG: FtsX-like permease family protein [Anaerolineae bacterium]|nr:FtsX-like permease family protein [Anaerolineae bacterium]